MYRSNKYDLSSAIAQVPAELRTNGLTVSFLNESGDTEKWEFSGGSWGVSSFSQIGAEKITELGNSKCILNRRGIITSNGNWLYSDADGYNHLLIPIRGSKILNGITPSNTIPIQEYFTFLKSSRINTVDFANGVSSRENIGPRLNKTIPEDANFLYISNVSNSIFKVVIDGNDVLELSELRYNSRLEDSIISIKNTRLSSTKIHNGLITSNNIWSISEGYWFVILWLKKDSILSVSDGGSVFNNKFYALLSSYNENIAIDGVTPDFIQTENRVNGYPANLTVNQDCYLYLSCNENEIPQITIDGIPFFIQEALISNNLKIKELESQVNEFRETIYGDLPEYDGFINNNNNWDGNIGYKFTIVKCNTGDIVTATGDSPLKKYALLKTVPSQPVPSGVTPDYIDSESSFHTGYPSDLSIPEDCYLYLQVSNDGTVYMPTVTINGHGLGFENRISALESGSNKGSSENVSIYLPGKIYVGSGIVIELYNRQVAYCQNYKNFFFSWDCQVIKIYDNKIRIEGTDDKEGEYPLTLKIYDCNYNLIDVKNSTVIIKSKGSNSNFNTVTRKKILCINDSYGTRAEWYVEMRKLFRMLSNSEEDEVVEFVGTQKTINGDYHEGYNGYRMDQFCTAGYASNVDVTVSGVTTPPQDGTSKPRYSCTVYKPNGNLYGTNEYEVEVAENNLIQGEDGLYSGTIRLNVVKGTSFQAFLPANGTLTKVNSEIGDVTIEFSSWKSKAGNPFYINEKLDFNAYCKNNNIHPDVITISMGTNGCQNPLNLSYTDDYVGTDYTPLYMKYFIDALRATEYDTSVGIDWSTIPIVIGHKPNTGDFVRDRETRLKYYSIAVNTEKLLKGYDNIYFVPFNIEVDSEHDFTTGITEPVNPRQEAITIVVNNQDVHPQLPGYYQMSDGYVSCIYIEIIN